MAEVSEIAIRWMSHKNTATLVQILILGIYISWLISGLFGAKPLAEPMLTYCQLDPKEQASMKFESNAIFFFKKCT